MGSVFSSSTIYQVVAVLETLFSVVTLAFGIKTLFVFLSQDDSFQSQKEIILYSAIAAVIHSTIQILASILLVAKSQTKARNSEGRRDPGIVPRLWLILSPFQLAVLLFIFVAPISYCVGEYRPFTDKSGKEYPKCGVDSATLTDEQKDELVNLRTSLHEMFTYVVTNIIFKVLFIWAVFSTVPLSCRKRSSGRHELINSNGNDGEDGEKEKGKNVIMP